MGNVGGAFAQSFAQTLIQGKQIMDAVADRKEELSLRKKLVSAQLQEHETKTALATRQLTALTGLRQRLQPGWGEEEGAGMQPAAPLSEQERLGFAMDIDPGAAAKELLTGGRRFSVEDATKMGRAFMEGQGGGQGAPPAPSPAPQAEGAAPVSSEPPAATSPGLGPQRKLDRTFGMSIDPTDGKMKLDFKVADRAGSVKIDHTTVVAPDGRAMVFREVSDAETGKLIGVSPSGPAVPPAETQKWEMVAGSLGLKPGTPLYKAAVYDFQRIASTMQPGRAQEIAFEDAVEFYRTQATARPAGAPAPAAPAGSPRARAQAEEVQQAGKVTKVKKEAEQSVPERASPEERKRIESNLTAADLYNQISASYKADFVGPVRGGLGATVREKTGLMAQQEQHFRTAITTANNRMINEITGAGLGEREAQRLLGQMPDPGLPPKQFEARLHMTKINNKIIAIRRRQVYEATGVDVSKTPPITLTTEERRAVAEPIAADYLKGQITREQAVQELMGLAQYGVQGAHAYLTAIAGGKR